MAGCLFWFGFRFVLWLDVWAVWWLGCYLAAGWLWVVCCVFVVAFGSFGVVCYVLLLLFVVCLKFGGWVLIVLCVYGDHGLCFVDLLFICLG